MRSQITPNHLRIELSIEECLMAAEGDIVGDRVNPIFPDAKIAVRRLEDYAAEDRDTIIALGQAVGQVFSNEDLDLYIPSRSLRMSYVARETISRSAIMGMNVSQDYLEHYQNVLPPEGIEVRFDGSMRRIDLSQQFA